MWELGYFKKFKNYLVNIIKMISILTCQSCTFTTPKHHQQKDATQHHLEISNDPYYNQNNRVKHEDLDCTWS